MEPWFPREKVDQETLLSERRKIRHELIEEIRKTKLRPWMLCIVPSILIAIQIFMLTSPDTKNNIGIGYPLLAIFAIASLIDVFLITRFIYFAWLVAFQNNGMEGFAKALLGPIPGIRLGVGRDLILGFTMLGMMPTVFGFVVGFVENDLLMSLPFHALALFHVFRFQLCLHPFIDRLSLNLAFAAVGEGPDIKDFLRITAHIYSEP